MNWKTRRYCGSFSLDHVDACLELSGWVDTIRDHGQVLFIHLRDRSGMVQIVFDATKPDGTPRKLLSVDRLHGLGWEHKIELPEGIKMATSWYIKQENKI